jgi:hypothetical protein
MELINTLLIAIPALIGIYGLLDSWKDNKKKVIVLASLIILFTAVSFYSHYQETEKLKYASDHGTFEYDSVKYPHIKIGGNTYNNGPNGVDLVNSAIPIDLKIAIENEQLVTSVVLRNDNGDVIVRVVENNWELKKDGLDKNFDKTAFEVVDSNDKVLFQIHVVDDFVYVYGIFYRADGYLSFADYDYMYYGWDNLDEYDIEPMFKYPSFAYPGVRVLDA